METLAVKYRPQTFEDVVEQDNIKKILMNQLNNGIRNAYLFCGPAGCGKAQPLYSKVLTSNGFVDMGSVKVGDTVYTRLGQPTKILNVYPQGERDIYEIQFSDGTSLRVADNHLNSVFRYNQDRQCREDFVLETKDLIELFNKTRFKLRVDIPVVNFESKEVPLNPYLLGCLLGDGHLCKESCGISNSEKDVLEKINNILVSEYNCELRHKTNYDYNIHRLTDSFRYYFTYKNITYKGTRDLIKKLQEDGYPKIYSETIINICNNNAPQMLKKYPELFDRIKMEPNENYDQSNTLTRIVNKMGICSTSKEKFIPKEYLFNSFEVRLSLLQGLFDTDGTTGNRGETCWSTSSPQLSEDFAFLVRSLGCRDTVKVKNSGYRNKEGVYIECGKHYTHFIKMPNDLQYCTSQKHISRKKVRQNEPIKNITDIKYVGKDLCQCIYVENEDHTYLSNDFIPTHNTTNARLFAKQINEGNDSNLVELDAASHSGVEDVRKLIADSKFKPVGCKYRVFIIDECHSLSNTAWQSFLKCLEEPTPTSVFIFCTTDPQKIPKTIISRVQQFDFSKITHTGIVNRLKYIINKENEQGNNYTYDEDSISYIAKLAEGGMRSAITLMEKTLGLNDRITMETVVASIGVLKHSTMFDLTDYLCKMDKKSVIQTVEDIHRSGFDLKMFIKNYTDFVLDLCKYDLFRDFENLFIPNTYEDRIKRYERQDFDFFLDLLNSLIQLGNNIKWDPTPKPLIESTLLLLCTEG